MWVRIPLLPILSKPSSPLLDFIDGEGIDSKGISRHLVFLSTPHSKEQWVQPRITLLQRQEREFVFISSLMGFCFSRLCCLLSILYLSSILILLPGLLGGTATKTCCISSQSNRVVDMDRNHFVVHGSYHVIVSTHVRISRHLSYQKLVGLSKALVMANLTIPISSSLLKWRLGSLSFPLKNNWKRIERLVKNAATKWAGLNFPPKQRLERNRLWQVITDLLHIPRQCLSCTQFPLPTILCFKFLVSGICVCEE